MIRKELNRDDEDLPSAARRDLGEELLQIGAQPFLRGMSRALIRPAPSTRRRRHIRRDELRRLAELRDVRRFGFEHATRKTVCREDDGRVAWGCFADELGKRLDERALVVPRLRD